MVEVGRHNSPLAGEVDQGLASFATITFSAIGHGIASTDNQRARTAESLPEKAALR
jgi:hypothetical protein